MTERPQHLSRPEPDAPASHGEGRRAERDGVDEHDDAEELLTPAEVAALFRVNPKTVTRWHRSGKISAIRTLGGHRRVRAREIHRLLEAGDAPASS